MAYEKIGGWLFILGVVIAIVAGLGAASLGAWQWIVTLALVLVGLVVGFLNISDKEVNDFLIAAIAVTLINQANLGVIPYIGTYLKEMVLNVVAFVGPAALVVALKAVYNLARKPSA